MYRTVQPSAAAGVVGLLYPRARFHRAFGSHIFTARAERCVAERGEIYARYHDKERNGDLLEFIRMERAERP